MATPMSPNRLWQRLRWDWQRHAGSRAWMPWLALVLVLLALACGFNAWQQHQEGAVPDVVQPSHRTPPAEDPATLARRELAHFYQALPPARSLSVPLVALLRLGDKHAVHFSEGEYHHVSDPDAPLVREDIILPVTASPADIQAFVQDAMQSLRPLTVSSLSFEREDVNASQVKARIHFVLLARGN